LRISLRPFRQVADTWPLRPADNQPNPCGTQVTTSSRRRGRPFYDRLSSFDLRSKSSVHRIICIGGLTRNHTPFSMSCQIDRVVTMLDVGVKRRCAGTERYLSRFLMRRE